MHECLFCPQIFDSAVDKDDHTLEHFPQEICSECDRNLIRIGSNLYTLHTTDTCFKDKMHPRTCIKTESLISSVINTDGELPNEGDALFHAVSSATKGLSGNSHAKFEFDPSSGQAQKESEIKVESSFAATDDDGRFQEHQNDIFSMNDEFQPEQSFEGDSDKSENKLNDDTMEDGNKRHRCVCNICAKSCFASALLRHKIRKHNFCVICTEAFPTKMEFKVHKPKCKKANKPSENTHCTSCNTTLKTRKTYLAHMRTIHNPLGKPHKCDGCGSHFRDAAGLRVHICRPEKDRQPRVFIDPKVHLIDGRYVCDVCNASLKTRMSLKMHKIFIHKELGDNVCKLCAKPFPGPVELSEHQIECQLKKQSKSLGDFKTFECDICKAVLKSKDGIRQHILHTHVKIAKRFKCEQCDLAFYARSEVKLHHKVVHLNVRDFICSVCGKAFKFKYQLNYHSFVHSNEKFKCLRADCDKYFASPMSRKKHMDTHREAAQEERVKCDLCGLSFVNKITLRNHHRFMHLKGTTWNLNI